MRRRLPRRRWHTNIRRVAARRYGLKSATNSQPWRNSKHCTGLFQSSCAPTMRATMAQFDVFVNPFASVRRAYPFVVAMQSDLTINGAEQLVAPIASNDYEQSSIRRVMPVVALQGNDRVVLVPRLTVIRSRDLIEKVGSIAAARTELLAAIDYLFFGV